MSPVTYEGTILDEGGAVYNVKAFGAVGDGTTDDRLAIQAAIDALNGQRAIVFFPPGSYKIDTGNLNVKRAHLMGSSAPGVTGGGGSVLRFSVPYGIHSSVQDNFGYELSHLQIRSTDSGGRTQNGQTLVDFTGQNYPRMRECRVGYAENGVKLDEGSVIECHYGAFFNVHFDKCYRGVYAINAHSQKFYGGRFWDCVNAVQNDATNDLVFFGSEFESDRPLIHPSGSSGSQTTVFVGTRLESDSKPSIAVGTFSDLGSYWSGYDRPTAFVVASDIVDYQGRIMTGAIRADNKPAQQNLLRNPNLVLNAAGTAIPGWSLSSGTPSEFVCPFGRMVRIRTSASSIRLSQSGIKLKRGVYSCGYGVQRDSDDSSSFELRLQVYAGGALIRERTAIPGGYRGGIISEGFTLDGDYDDVKFVIYLNGTANRTAFIYSPYLVPGHHADRYTLVTEYARPFEERWGSAAPSSGSWQRGAVVWNDTPSPGESIGWVCTAAGLPGTWKPFGTIAN